MINLFGFFVTVGAYKIAEVVKKVPALKRVPPILLAAIFVVLVLKIFDVDFQTYNESAKYLTYLLFPATIALGCPIYKNINLLKKNKRIIISAFFLATVIALISTYFLAVVCHSNQDVIEQKYT